nr:hypothetical protein [uncultured Rhodopila sp.]
MPALAKLPSGSFVDVACGQPAQKAGARRSRPSGRETASGDALRRQFHQRRQQRRAARVRLAADLGAFIRRQVVERVADLAFDETALFLDHDQRALAAGEGAQPFRLQRPGHADLVDGEFGVGGEVEAAEGVQRVLMRLADGNHADAGLRRAAGDAVDAVGAGPGQHGGHPFLDHPTFEFRSICRELQQVVEVQAVRRVGYVRGDEVAA